MECRTGAVAESYGRVIDILCPEIDPHLNKNEFKAIVLKNLQEIIKFQPTAVLYQGELNYTVIMVEELKKLDITVMAATGERVVEEIAENCDTPKKISFFKFVCFRHY